VRDPDQHFALAGRFDIDFDDLEGLACLEGNGGSGFHGRIPGTFRRKSRRAGGHVGHRRGGMTQWWA